MVGVTAPFSCGCDVQGVVGNQLAVPVEVETHEIAFEGADDDVPGRQNPYAVVEDGERLDASWPRPPL